MNEEELIKRSAEERERIFSRYEDGRKPGAQIDAWEDPGFEVYHKADRYGFIHDERLPQKMDPNEKKLKDIEMTRVKKWTKMLSKWNEQHTKDKLHKRIYKGIPDSLRSDVWSKLLELQKQKEKNVNVYEKMLSLAKQWSPDARQIDSDVNRQFRDHIDYRERYSLKQKSLFHVLVAYSMYNMEVGYCQGMSGLAGVLLMYMDEEDAFWALSVLLTDKKYAMHGLYIEGFPKLTRFLEHHDKILTKFMPKLKKHFDRYGLDAILYSLKWFFVCFVERVPFSLCLRIWDIYLLDGEKVITAMAYTVLKLHKKHIMRLNDMDLIVNYIQVKLFKDFGYDEDTVIEALEKSMEELKKAKLDHPGPPQPNELPQQPFGKFTEPTFEKKVGRRAEEFTETEKATKDAVVLKREKTELEVAVAQRNSHMSVGDSSAGLAGSKFSFDPSMDDASSLLECHQGGSRRSLADTSVTSTADLSVFSTATRSHVHDNSLDTHSNMSDGSAGGASSGCGSGLAVNFNRGLGTSGSIQRVPSTHSTPRATPGPSHVPSPDIVRIYVPYSSPLHTPIVSPQTGDLKRSPPPSLSLDGNKIRIHIDTQDEQQTPLVEYNPIKPFRIDSPEVDLK